MSCYEKGWGDDLLLSFDSFRVLAIGKKLKILMGDCNNGKLITLDDN